MRFEHVSERVYSIHSEVHLIHSKGFAHTLAVKPNNGNHVQFIKKNELNDVEIISYFITFILLIVCHFERHYVNTSMWHCIQYCKHNENVYHMRIGEQVLSQVGFTRK